MVARLVHEHLSTTNMTKLTTTLIVIWIDHVQGLQLTHADIMAVSFTHGHWSCFGALCRLSLLHPDVLHQDVPMAETHR